MSTTQDPPAAKPDPKSTALTRQVKEIRTCLETNRDALARGISRYVTVERLLDIACVVASRQPKLAECTPMSVYRAVKMCAQIGLEPMDAIGHAYLVPYANRDTGQREAQLIIGYKGLCELGNRSGAVKRIDAHVVYQGDKCKVTLEPPDVVHDWDWENVDRAREQIIGTYCVVDLTNGAKIVRPMTIGQVESVRARSRARDSGPWVTDYPAMVRKTVIRATLMSGSVPLTPAMADALAADLDQPEVIKAADVVIPGRDPDQVDAPPPDKGAEAVKRKLGKQEPASQPEQQREPGADDDAPPQA